MNYGKFLGGFLSLIIPSILYVYYYPWLYNKVNGITGRGEDLDDKMDFINVLVMFLITWVIIGMFVIFITRPLLMKKK